MLKPQYGDKNLYQGIRKEAIEYFKKYGITWWQCIKKPDEPTSHMVSSQINCLNHLFAFRDKPEALKLILQKATLLPIKSILTSPIDEDGYIAFEFVYKNMSLMCDNTGKYHENYESRGTKCTSIDALVYAQLEDNRKVLIPIEWKYTETYKREDKTNRKRLNRYKHLIECSERLKTPPLLLVNLNFVLVIKHSAKFN